MLKLENVSKYYNSNDMTNLGLHNINLELHRNEIVAIVGDSGAGKSTLLNVISKMDTFDEGEIYYKGNETSYFNVDDMDDFRKNKVGFIFQNYNIIDSYTVLENVELPLILRGINGKDARKKALELINKVGLKDRINNRGTQLSGGEKQRCVIARALAGDCEILACDEPTGNLDSETSLEIIELIKEIAQDKLVLIVTHNYDLIKDMVTRKIRIHDGEIVEDVILKETQNNVFAKTDEFQELDLDYVPLKKKVSARVSLNNILKTPKRTILTSLIFLFVAFFILTLFQFIIYINSDQTYYNNFTYKGDNKLIVYNSGVEIDLNDIEKVSTTYVVNPFYETTYVYGSEIGNKNNYVYVDMYSYEANPSKLHLDGGRMPENEDECILLISSYYDIDEGDILDQYITFEDYTNLSIKVVGYQFRSDIDEATITHCDKAAKFFTYYTIIATNNDFSISDVSSLITSAYYDVNLDKSYIYLPVEEESYLSLNITANLTYSNYKLLENFAITDIRIKDSTSQSLHKDKTITELGTIYIGNDIIDKLDDKAYEVSVYGNVNTMSKQLDKLNLSYLNPKTYTEYADIFDVLLNISSYFMIFSFSWIIVVIYFITYIILVRVYTSKKKDYAILRTLGITKKDMRFIVKCEVLSVSMLIAFIVYVTFFILGKTVHNEFFSIYESINLFTTILYFAVMFFLSLILALHFNKRLFKFSVNKSFKNGEAKHD